MGKVFCHERPEQNLPEDQADTGDPCGFGRFAADHHLPAQEDPPPKSGKPLSHAKGGFVKRLQGI